MASRDPADSDPQDSSDPDTEDLFASPSRVEKKKAKPPVDQTSEKARNGEPRYDSEEGREAALQKELEGVRSVNDAIEGVVGSLERARGNMETVSRTVNSASTLLNTWIRILSQTEHNQRLILNPSWEGASQDLADVENESILQQQAAERRELEEQQRREAAARRAAEEERRRTEPAAGRSTKERQQHKALGTGGPVFLAELGGLAGNRLGQEERELGLGGD
ncbi:MAG: hypothetical protein M1833_002447 [Piccolia ochrophora]|nr:MAG: hypothetical protein M1833_002447 [Piccolia ochrophora]